MSADAGSTSKFDASLLTDFALVMRQMESLTKRNDELNHQLAMANEKARSASEERALLETELIDLRSALEQLRRRHESCASQEVERAKDARELGQLRLSLQQTRSALTGTSLALNSERENTSVLENQLAQSRAAEADHKRQRVAAQSELNRMRAVMQRASVAQGSRPSLSLSQTRR